MISRVRHGYTTQGYADPYKHLPKDEVEFITVLWFDLLGAMRLFAREEYERAILPPSAPAVLMRFDGCSQHYEVREALKAD